MPTTLFAAASALALAAPLHARTLEVAAGDGAQTRLQEALILAKPGDVVQLGAGRFALTDGLSLDVKGVTVRGMGMDATVLDFTGQKGAGEGLLVTSDDVTQLCVVFQALGCQCIDIELFVAFRGEIQSRSRYGDKQGGDAIALLYVDEPVKQEVLDKLTANPAIRQAKPLVFNVD